MQPFRVIVLLFFLSTMTFTFSYSQNQSEMGENKAILEALEKDSHAWSDRDYETWKDAWVHDASASLFLAHRNNYEVLLGWEQINEMLGGSIKSSPEKMPRERMENIKIHNHGNVATVSLDVYPNAEPGTLPMKELKTLIKKDGTWKIMQVIATMPESYTVSGIEQSMGRNAQLLTENGELDKAMKLLEANAELYPESADSWTYLGMAFADAGDKDQAIRHFEKALQIDSQHALALERLKELKE